MSDSALGFEVLIRLSASSGLKSESQQPPEDSSDQSGCSRAPTSQQELRGLAVFLLLPQQETEAGVSQCPGQSPLELPRANSPIPALPSTAVYFFLTSDLLLPKCKGVLHINKNLLFLCYFSLHTPALANPSRLRTVYC